MNLWLRLIGFLLRAPFRPPLVLPHEVSVLTFRVWPLDIDTSLHMNNGRYLALMDFGRLDVMVASGLWRVVLRHGWTPIAGAVVIRFRRELRCFDKFRIETKVLCWDDTAVVMEQIFVVAAGPRQGEVAARALFKGGLYDRKARKFVEMTRLLAEVGVTAASPPRTPEVGAFLTAEAALRETTPAQT